MKNSPHNYSDDIHREVHIYTPESGLANPVQLIKGMWHDTFSHQARDLAWRLFRRNLAAQYRQTIFGYMWVALPPLLMSLVWIFLNAQQVVKVTDTGIPYALYAFTGNILWQSFLLSMQIPIQRANAERGTITKLNYSRESILAAGFLESLFTAFIQLVLLIPVLLYFHVDIGLSLLLAPAGIFMLVLMGVTAGTLLTPIGLLYQDIGRGIPIIGRFWFFITPVVYPLPTEFPGKLLNYLNPVAPVITNARNWITGQPATLVLPFIIIMATTIALLLFGLLVYRLAMPHIVERMSA